MTRADEIHLLSTELIFWQAYEPSVKADLCSCAVMAREVWVLIDPIDLTEEAADEFTAYAKPSMIVLTNGNHTRAAPEIARRMRIPIIAHADAVADLGIKVDRVVVEGDVVAGDLRVVTLSGAGPGEIALYLGGKSLHIGDALINLQPHGFTLLPEKYCADAHLMRRSLRKLIDLEFATITFAHGEPLVKDSKLRLTRLIA